MTRLSLINRYFNYGYTGRAGKIISVIAPEPARQQAAKKICHSFQAHSANTRQHPDSVSISYTIPKFETGNQALSEISAYIKTNLEPYIHAAVVHGSVATGEIINYSDYDGLVVIKNDVFKSIKQTAELSCHLNRTFAMMLRFDPLQHHGWMIATEKDFDNWPGEFFPPALFQFSKSLLGSDCKITLNCIEPQEKLKSGFLRYAGRLNHTLRTAGLPDNAYQMKSILSEFMLLPSLYVAARDGKGVFKKFSFEIAASDFSGNDWDVMNKVSEIRMKWPSMNYVKGFQDLKRFTPFTKNQQIRRSRFRNHQSPVNDLNLFREMSELTEKMILKLT